MVDLSISDIASVCHEANRQLQIMFNEENISPRWGDCSKELQRSIIAGVTKALDGETPQQLHDSWLQHKASQGWVYGEKKDEEEKTHPNIVVYDNLPDEQKLKDVLFRNIVIALSGAHWELSD